MTANPRWDRIEELFGQISAVPPAERAAWLDEHCGDAPDIRAELESLLNAQDGAPSFIERLSDELVGRGAQALVGDETLPNDESVVRQLLDGTVDERARLESLIAALADRYVIEKQIGTGGMATVFLASDVKHKRKVAVKVLRPHLAAVLGAERFLKEIEVTANLQRPHILPLFDSGSVGSIPYYVMPFIEGESLEQRLARERQLPIEEAVTIAVAVGQALAYAHDNDVVHRDIKPANILMQRGQPLVADFGIALAVTAAGGKRLTETGLSIGTPEYMSPEQASGSGGVDARTDQYALACVLYEMLVGEPPHSGPTVPAIIKKVLLEPPRRIRAARETVPLHIEIAVHRALSKLPADRYRTVSDFTEAVVNPAVTREWLGLIQLKGISWRTWAQRVALVVLGIAAIIGWMRADPDGDRRVTRFDFPYPSGEAFSAVRHVLAISPDGSTIAYAGQGEEAEQLYLRRNDQLSGRAMPGTEGALDPFFSPDGESVGFATLVGLMRMPVTGGAPVRIVDFPEPRGPVWGPDGTILFGSTSGLWRVPVGGGQPERVTTLDSARGEVLHNRPQFLPGGDAVLFTLTTGGVEDMEVAVLSLRSGEITGLFPGIAPRYAHTGHIVYGRADGMLMAAPFDHRRLVVMGSADTLLSGVAIRPAGSMEFALSEAGDLVYLTGGDVTGRLALVDRTGAQEFLTGPTDLLTAPIFSPRGDRIIVGRGLPPTRQIWALEMADRSLSPITFDGHNYYPVLSPDGSRVAFTTENPDGSADLRWKASDGSGTAQVLVRADPGALYYPESWSPDGRYIVTRRQETRDDQIDRDLWIVRVDGSQEPSRLFDLPASLEDAARISPDGGWLAFTSDLTGQYQVYVTRFPAPGRRIPISLSGGTEPAWAPDGRDLFYRNGNDMMVATLDLGDELRVIDRQVMFTGRYLAWHYHTNYDVHPDGQRFAMVASWGTGASHRVVVVMNWIDELRRLTQQNS